MKKKIPSIILVILIFILSLLTNLQCVFANEVIDVMTSSKSFVVLSGNCGPNVTYELDSNGILTIIGTGDMENYKSGSAPWYSRRESIRNVVIKNGVTSVGKYAFEGCNMTNIAIPDSVTKIGERAFYGCLSLSTITVGRGVTSIESCAFLYCGLFNVYITDLTAWSRISFGDVASNPAWNMANVYIDNERVSKLVLPAGTTSIGDFVYAGWCMDSITIPDSVTSIGQEAFFNCWRLSSVNIPQGVTHIGDGAFSSCSLTEITIPDSVTSIGVHAFAYCGSLTELTIPKGVTSIGRGAFNGCSGLSKIIIPDSVISIGDSAFWYCDGLSSIMIPASVVNIGEDLFF